MKARNYLLLTILLSTISACSSESQNTCDDLMGFVTHSDIEITGIESTSLVKRNSDTGAFEAVDQFNGANFSHLIMQIDLSWIEEQHRNGAPSTFIQSMLDWFISPAMACTLAPYYEVYEPEVASIEIYSDNDLNEEYVAGSNLAKVFAAFGVMSGSNTLLDASENGDLQSARMYSVQSAWLEGTLATMPATPATHVFTILLTLDDGRAFEARTAEVLLSGI